ncbi:competence/damage-inducible protein CinA C-domain [Firmicutes bacterium CAG:460]|nr:competence/damage-inducible protein CinA C-domain [Firmicutes bacterium CAG:460]
MKLEEIVKILTKQNKTISTMESCTGGALANAITNIPGASEILKFSAVTYSNEFKIKMGVPKEIINTYSVYSIETAIEMSKKISEFTNSNYGIGITGKLNRADLHNLSGDNSTVYFSIYNKDNNTNYNGSLKVTKETRKENKEEVINLIVDKLYEIIKTED